MGSASPSATDPDWSIRATVAGPRTSIALIRPGDVLLSEVSFGAGPVPADAAHLAGPDVGHLATRTGVGAVLLTHILMSQDRRRDDRIGRVPPSMARCDSSIQAIDSGSATYSGSPHVTGR